MKLTKTMAEEIVRAWQLDLQLIETVRCVGGHKGYIDFADLNKTASDHGIIKHQLMVERVQTWVPKNFPKANLSLWNGNFSNAVAHMVNGENPAKNTKTPAQEARHELKKSNATITIRARELDKKHDWGTVK
jgi:hypothetical protein